MNRRFFGGQTRLATSIAVALAGAALCISVQGCRKGGLRNFRPLEEQYRAHLSQCLRQHGVVLNSAKIGDAYFRDPVGAQDYKWLYIDATLNKPTLAQGQRKGVEALEAVMRLIHTKALGPHNIGFITVQWRSPDYVQMDIRVPKAP
jgi:hypothetical protein